MRHGQSNSRIGAVVIGRNEGERLVSCLTSLKSKLDDVVYVDSGSTDKSIQNAANLAVQVVTLDLSIPFTAARARNEGARELLNINPDLTYIQFVDGDCEVQNNWLTEAEVFLDSHNEYAVVCGRRRERFPHNSIFNTLCDIEWATSIGEALSCGGDSLIRVTAFKEIDGFTSALIAGEEPEMCFRLRMKDWKIYRLNTEMTLHDAAMTRINQWWKRAERAGYAYANGFDLHGKSAEKFKKKEVVSIIFWAMVLPILLLTMSIQLPLLLGLFMVYPAQILKVSIQDTRRFNRVYGHSFIYAFSSVMAKFPQSFGIVKFYKNKLKGQQGSIIEYK